ncbi:preprotein translocase subunit SecG [Phenylobacterium sp. J367]|uniref:preprotein translocase subunit SecG n=1 Tax=Phenylobacterium sp. J367 TaxID=2898435 RepID=UPI0027E32942|nr:preprotein translocase subunit SecG [Phenylobacterium sp. J367]
MLLTILLVIEVLVSLGLVGVVLLQRSEGGALGMGGGPSGFMTARGAGRPADAHHLDPRRDVLRGRPAADHPGGPRAGRLLGRRPAEGQRHRPDDAEHAAPGPGPAGPAQRPARADHRAGPDRSQSAARRAGSGPADGPGAAAVSRG